MSLILYTYFGLPTSRSRGVKCTFLGCTATKTAAGAILPSWALVLLCVVTLPPTWSAYGNGLEVGSNAMSCWPLIAVPHEFLVLQVSVHAEEKTGRQTDRQTDEISNSVNKFALYFIGGGIQNQCNRKYCLHICQVEIESDARVRIGISLYCRQND